MLHDLFTIAVNGKRQGGRILLLPTVYAVIKYQDAEMDITCDPYYQVTLRHKSNQN